MRGNRAAGGALWSLDKGGRWRSQDWLRWVRGLRCCCGMEFCPNCRGRTGMGDSVEAAHWRHGAAVGMGRKPDDFFTYPLAWSVHRRFHAGGEPSNDVQRGWVLAMWRRAVGLGILEPADAAVARWLADPPDAPGETLAVTLRAAFASGDIVMRDPFYASIPF